MPLGTTFFGNNRHGIALAEAICDAVPCADQVRFVCSGTEADLYAMRAVRAFRKRDKILKFEGGYHGMSDYALMSLAPKRPGNFPRPTPDSAGIPKSVADEHRPRAQQEVDIFSAGLVPDAAALALSQHHLGRHVAEAAAGQDALGLLDEIVGWIKDGLDAHCSIPG